MSSGSGSTAAAIIVAGLVKHFEDVRAVDGVDLEILRGECFGLLGPNGAGKTTTIEILEGLTEADAGTVRLLGQAWGQGQDDDLRQRLGIQLQETQLGDKQTVIEVLTLFRSLYGRGHDPDEVIGLLELEPKRDVRIHKLSGGQKQRLALACALICDPEILFLDEPTTGLDPQARLQVWNIVERYREAGTTVLLTTHYMEEAAQLCDRVAIMDRGKVIAIGSPAEHIAALGVDQIIEIVADGDLDAERLGRLEGVDGASRRGDRLVLRVDSVGKALPALLRLVEREGLTVEQLHTHQATLDDVFLHLTGRDLRDEV